MKIAPYFMLCITLVMFINDLTAQTRVALGFGASLPNISTLNEQLSLNGQDKLNPINTTVLLEVVNDLDYFSTHTKVQAIIQEGNRNSLNGLSIGLDLGVKVINKYKSKLNFLVGYTYFSSPIDIRLQQGVAVSQSFNQQLQNPSSNLIELSFNSRSYLNLAMDYGFKLRSLDLSLRGGYYLRLSRVRWESAGQNISDGPSINPLGAYLQLLSHF